MDVHPAAAAERQACLAEFIRLFDRLKAIEIKDRDGEAVVSGEALRIELRRIGEVIESVRIGLRLPEQAQG